MKKIQKGFTLIELMIVVAIIGILAAVAIPAYQDYVVKAKLSKVQSTLDPVKLALAMYAQENGSFPNSSTAATVWTSIGISTPTLPAEVSTLAVDGTALNSVKLTLTLAGIKATGIDGLKVDIIGSSGSTAVTWQAGDGAGNCATANPVTDAIAKKYFNCL